MIDKKSFVKSLENTVVALGNGFDLHCGNGDVTLEFYVETVDNGTYKMTQLDAYITYLIE